METIVATYLDLESPRDAARFPLHDKVEVMPLPEFLRDLRIAP